jgi:hypothetical protein
LALPSESSKLEGEGDFVEYVGSGKLKGKKVLITGREYDPYEPMQFYHKV